MRVFKHDALVLSLIHWVNCWYQLWKWKIQEKKLREVSIKANCYGKADFEVLFDIQTEILIIILDILVLGSERRRK